MTLSIGVGGVGITPMMAIAEHVVEEDRRTGAYRPIHFIHGAQTGRVRAFSKRIQELAAEHPALSVHVCLSGPAPEDNVGVTYNRKAARSRNGTQAGAAEKTFGRPQRECGPLHICPVWDRDT